jgi:hypothetical protein
MRYRVGTPCRRSITLLRNGEDPGGIDRLLGALLHVPPAHRRQGRASGTAAAPVPLHPELLVLRRDKIDLVKTVGYVLDELVPALAEGRVRILLVRIPRSVVSSGVAHPKR